MKDAMKPDAMIRLMIVMQAAVAAASLTVEIVAGRMLAPYVGMSVYTWTSVIAVVLAGFSAGHWLGGRIAEKPADRALAITGWSMLGAALTTAAAVFLLRWGSGPVMGVFDSSIAVIVILTTLAFFLPSFFAGIPAPVMAEIGAKVDPSKSGRTLGAMFASSAFGAILGTLAAGFVMIAWFGSTLSLAIVTVVYLVLALIFFRMAKVAALSPAVLLSMALPLAVAGLAVTRADPCDTESRYFCIRVIDVAASPESPVNLMVLDHLAHGITARDAAQVMFTDHGAMMDHLGRAHFEGREARVFVIGGGSFTIPRSWSFLDPRPDMVVSEIDPEVTRVASEDFWFDPATAEVTAADARVALARRSDQFDVILGDAFTDIAIPVHLVTAEFFGMVRDRMTPDGVYLMNVIDHAGHYRALGAIFRTLETVFPVVEVWTEARPYEEGERMIFIVRGAEAPTEFSAFEALSPSLRRYGRMSAKFLERLREEDDLILTDDFAPIERLIQWKES